VLGAGTFVAVDASSGQFHDESNMEQQCQETSQNSPVLN